MGGELAVLHGYVEGLLTQLWCAAVMLTAGHIYPFCWGSEVTAFRSVLFLSWMSKYSRSIGMRLVPAGLLGFTEIMPGMCRVGSSSVRGRKPVPLFLLTFGFSQPLWLFIKGWLSCAFFFFFKHKANSLTATSKIIQKHMLLLEDYELYSYTNSTIALWNKIAFFIQSHNME